MIDTTPFLADILRQQLRRNNALGWLQDNSPDIGFYWHEAPEPAPAGMGVSTANVPPLQQPYADLTALFEQAATPVKQPEKRQEREPVSRFEGLVKAVEEAIPKTAKKKTLAEEVDVLTAEKRKQAEEALKQQYGEEFWGLLPEKTKQRLIQSWKPEPRQQFDTTEIAPIIKVAQNLGVDLVNDPRTHDFTPEDFYDVMRAAGLTV